MSVVRNVSDDGLDVTINVTGRFDFALHQAFRDAYETVAAPEARYTLDLGQTEYMDSSALGMLLMLREHAGGDVARVSIRNCREEVKNVLTIANFQRLFEIR